MVRHAGIGRGSRCSCAADGGPVLVDVLQSFDTFLPVAEQVIEVPKVILEDSIPPRTPGGSANGPCFRRAGR